MYEDTAVTGDLLGFECGCGGGGGGVPHINANMKFVSFDSGEIQKLHTCSGGEERNTKTSRPSH